MVTAIALIKTQANRIPHLADVISDTMRLRDSIVETETMIAFQAYANPELDAGFDLGLD